MFVRLSRRLKAYHALETSSIKIYRELSRLFPEAGVLWDYLEAEEEEHAESLIKGYVFEGDGTFPEKIVPHSSPLYNEALHLARDIKESIAKRKVSSLHKALEAALALEKSKAGTYLYDLQEQKTDREIISYLQKFHDDEKRHLQRINEFVS